MDADVALRRLKRVAWHAVLCLAQVLALQERQMNIKYLSDISHLYRSMHSSTLPVAHIHVAMP